MFNDILIKEFKEFEVKYDKYTSSDVRLIDVVVKYLSKHKGKMLRPALVFQIAKSLGGKVNDKTYVVACLVEMIHVATLIHDDIVDESELRRGWPTIGKIWKNKTSILVGDYLFSKALSSIIDLKDFKSIQILSAAATSLSRGEILQIEKSKSRYMDEDVYFKMIEDKTASLFMAACELSARTVTSDNQLIEKSRQFGKNFGIAYQIKDDIDDVVGSSDRLGKPTNLDIKKNMITLPYIYSLNDMDKKSRLLFINKLKSLSKKNKTKEIKKEIDKYDGLKKTKSVLRSYIDKSNKFMDEICRDSKNSFIMNRVFNDK
ncbi:MAG: polyprenyl synthetase [Candidatus Marinimicrobia bacterium]|nr:polyprenyl synthetase [Candidatus Neomarinimicrobiota bacterium]|tara:strand:+ start:33 stop:983 length:951 start_codon:yes stop_codon:yes gene_type:complete